MILGLPLYLAWTRWDSSSATGTERKGVGVNSFLTMPIHWKVMSASYGNVVVVFDVVGEEYNEEK